MENQLWTNFSLILQIKIFWTLAHEIVPYVLFVEIRAQTQMQKPMCATKHACIFIAPCALMFLHRLVAFSVTCVFYIRSSNTSKNQDEPTAITHSTSHSTMWHVFQILNPFCPGGRRSLYSLGGSIWLALFNSSLGAYWAIILSILIIILFKERINDYLEKKLRQYLENWLKYCIFFPPRIF